MGLVSWGRACPFAHQNILGRVFTLERLVDVTEAAHLLGCTPAAIRKWLYQRRHPRVKLGRLTRVRLSDLETILERGLPALHPALEGCQRGQGAR